MKLGFIYCRFEILNPSFGFFPLNKIEFAESEVRVCPAGWLSVEMNKLLEFGRKAMFYVRVLSGYEERRIRSYRLELQRRLEQAHEKKAALRRVPEQVILSEVRNMVEEMQALNKKLEETEAAIEEYFKPLDKEAEFIMKMQLDGEESTKELLETLQKQALLEKLEEERNANTQNAETSKQHNQDPASAPSHAQMR